MASVVVLACMGDPRVTAPGGPYPAACGQFFLSERRCAAVVSRTLDDTGIRRDEVAAISLLPLPSQAPHFGPGIVAVVELKLEDGSVVKHTVVCVGISGHFDPACGDQAVVELNQGVELDVPCDAEPPGGCATLPPTPHPDLVAQATPLRIPEVAVPIDHAGHYELRLGPATLPNGYLSERVGTLGDETPATYWISGAALEVRPDVAGRPFVGSRYREAYDGLEPVTVFLVFEVIQYESPGMLRFQNIVVR